MKGSFDVTVNLLPCDLEVTGLSYENNLLQSRIILHTIDVFLGSRALSYTGLLLLFFLLAAVWIPAFCYVIVPYQSD